MELRRCRYPPVFPRRSSFVVCLGRSSFLTVDFAFPSQWHIFQVRSQPRHKCKVLQLFFQAVRIFPFNSFESPALQQRLSEERRHSLLVCFWSEVACGVATGDCHWSGMWDCHCPLWWKRKLLNWTCVGGRAGISSLRCSDHQIILRVFRQQTILILSRYRRYRLNTDPA